MFQGEHSGGSVPPASTLSVGVALVPTDRPVAVAGGNADVLPSMVPIWVLISLDLVLVGWYCALAPPGAAHCLQNLK